MGGAHVLDAGPELIEREQESEVLEALVDGRRDGGGAVVLRGEAGIGKSALLHRVRLRAQANGARPLATIGVESEADVARLRQVLRRQKDPTVVAGHSRGGQVMTRWCG